MSRFNDLNVNEICKFYCNKCRKNSKNKDDINNCHLNCVNVRTLCEKRDCHRHKKHKCISDCVNTYRDNNGCFK